VGAELERAEDMDAEVMSQEGASLLGIEKSTQ